MSGGVWRQVETVRREKEEKICLITSWYFEELLNTRDFRDLIWILWFCVCVQFPKLANDKNVLVSKYLHSAEVKPGMLSESCAFLRELCFVSVNPSNLFAFLVFFDSRLYSLRVFLTRGLANPPGCYQHTTVKRFADAPLLLLLFRQVRFCMLCKKQMNQASKPLFIQHFVPDW